MSFIFFIILILLIIRPDVSANHVIQGCQLWISTLVPAMYPSFICIDMIANSNTIHKLSKLLFRLFNKIFNINSEASCFIILISFLCGAPASTKLVVNYLENGKISKMEADNLICAFSFLSLPFVILTIKNLTYIYLFYISNFIISMIWMKYNNKKEIKKIISYNNEKNLIELFSLSIKKNIEILLNILGTIIIFRIVINLLVDNNFVFYSYIEILGGISKLIFERDKYLILSSLGFLGLSVHCQILSVYPKLNYSKFFLARIIFLLNGFLFAFLI